MKEKIVNESIESRAAGLADLSDRIWDYAETAFVEFKSADALCEALEKEGFKVERNVADIKTAFTGTFGSGKPVIGILGEFDALFNLSQKSGQPSCEPEIPGAPGHGCGHNIFGVASLAAAIAVKEYIQKTGCSGTVIYYGTPGEEGGSGKTFMAREGVFDCLDAAVTWHPSSSNTVRTSTSLANIQARFTFKGIASHAGATPHKGRSALDALELMNVGVNFMREHVRSDARIHYSITNPGGKSPNVVQPIAEAIYLCRSPRIKEAQTMYEWICDIAKGAALMTQTKVSVEFMKASSNLVTNLTLARIMQKNMTAFPLPEQTKEDIETAQKFYDTYDVNLAELEAAAEEKGPEFAKAFKEGTQIPLVNYVTPLYEKIEQGFGSTDVGDVSWVCPTVQLSGATCSYGTPGHSWQMVAQGKLPFAHKGLLYAGKVMAGTVIDLLNDPTALDEAKAEHKKRIGDGYVCPIPKGIVPQALK